MKVTKRQLKRIIKEELKVVKRNNNKLNENRVEISEYDDFVLVNYMVDEAYTIGYSVDDIRRLIAVLEAAIPKAEAGELEIVVRAGYFRVHIWYLLITAVLQLKEAEYPRVAYTEMPLRGISAESAAAYTHAPAPAADTRGYAA